MKQMQSVYGTFIVVIAYSMDSVAESENETGQECFRQNQRKWEEKRDKNR